MDCREVGRSDGQLGLSHCWTWTVLPSVPMLLLLLIGFPELRHLSSAEVKPRTRQNATAKFLCWLKLGLALTSAATQVALHFLLRNNNKESFAGLGQSAEACLRVANVIALLLSSRLHWLAYHKLKHSSTALLFFWLAQITASAAQLNDLALASKPFYVTPASVAAGLFLAQALVVFVAELQGPEAFDQGVKLQDDLDQDVDYSGREAPEEKANIFSVLFFSWMTPMMKLGYNKHLVETDLWALPKEDQADAIRARFSSKWERQRRLARDGAKKQPSPWIALAQAYGKPYLAAALFKAVQDVLGFAQPQLLKMLLAFVNSYRSDEPQPASHGFAIAGLMLLSACCQTLALHQYFARCFLTNMRVRSGLISAIYRKSLVISSEERSSRASGDIVNLQSTDATRIGEVLVYGQTLWSGSFQIVLAFVSLYFLMGFYGLLGAMVMIAAVPLNSFVARVQARMQAKQMKNKDNRSRIMNEILNNIRTIKLACWEEAFASRLFAVRNDKELPMLAKIGYLNSATTFLWSFVPFFVGFATFAAVALGSDITLTSQIVFPALSLLNLLTFPLAMLPNVITATIEAFVSAQRLVSFLDAGELQEDAVHVIEPTEPLNYGEPLVKVEKGTTTWSRLSAQPVLQDIDLEAKKGELLAIVGRVGSGKSSILSSVLGEMTKLSGQFTVKGSIAYVPQNPWIMGGTVRDNITFGAKFDQEFYDIVVEACALKTDLSILPSGDQSEVGEKGLALSGGQKARLSLARAVYSRADIYLLDDPLSAVDSHVGRHLFDRVIGGQGLLAGKARILCTNAIHFIQHADEILMLRSGEIIERGTWASTRGSGSPIAALLEEFGKSDNGESDSSDSEDTAVEKTEKAMDSTDNLKATEALKRRASHSITRRASYLSIQEHKAQTFRVLKMSSRPTESRETGSVKFDTYKKFVQSNGYFPFFCYLTTTCLSQGFNVLTSVWLKRWAEHNTIIGVTDNITYYLGVYFGLGFGTASMSFATGVILYTFCVVRSARTLHDGMFQAVMRSPMLFFETTPIGTILNRFSRDIYVIDEMLARFIRDLMRMVAIVASVLIVVETAVPLYIFVVIPVFFLYRQVQKYYLATSRELKRLDATTRSPIFASFSETLNGISTIRGYAQQERFVAVNEGRLDRNQECYYPSVSCNRWLAVRLELMGGFLIFAAATLSVISLVTGGPMDAGLVGIIITFSLQITGSLNWLVRAGTEVETNIVSVERVLQYSELKPEAPMHVEGVDLPESWPSKGEIKFDGFSTRYRPELDLVLRNINVKVDPAEKVGIVGRTGAGKSSLSSALFRIIEPASGTIYIDGVDISKIGLADLRSRLSIIPQDAQCFEGTLRENLDPPGKATDHDLWQALENSGLKTHAEAMGGLESHIEEGGSNLSSGQRQLMCFARALIRKSKILVLDEATAQVDVESDKSVQQIIRSEFSDRTILTVAHRLNTIADSDRILTLDHGEVKEFDSPSALLATPGSIYLGMATESGIVGGSKKGSARTSAAPTPKRSPTPKS